MAGAAEVIVAPCPSRALEIAEDFNHTLHHNFAKAGAFSRLFPILL